ncbi:Rieske (2Fe-2S) protein [Parahaliea aestuarii]|uniref:Rieske 2Fe-2S domain-containing protein n=1 Tax=Parahaliea aestuarii TaxID=1852021 RepID=A0A5C9A2H1_9GAMM|nr:Rieske 2Fe-2S domain-containing protein [Parahaliea aestuarii]TXS95065.1 Rieske 2Fe-2S domain-containing protein [Parahaliea aestuarii]
MENFQAVFAAEELDNNTARAVDVDGVNVLVCNAGGTFYAVINQCTHQASELEGGRIRNCFISCPLHGARFDLRDGSTKGQLTQIPLTTYPVRVVDGQVEVAVD